METPEECLEYSKEANEETVVSDIQVSQEQKNQLMAEIETVLFMSDKPMSLPKLRSILNPELPLQLYRELVGALREDSLKGSRGVEIAEVSMGFQFRTKPHMSPVIRKLAKTQSIKLSPVNMEVLTLVAYKQPLTRDDLDGLRGGDSSYGLRNLMEKKLVRIVGRSDLPGRPLQYGTTHEFLELFSLKDLSALPPLHELESMVATSEVGEEEQQKQALENFSKLVDHPIRELFEDSHLEEELNTIREEISQIPVSTPYLESLKAAEAKAQDHEPSQELEEQAELAQKERHLEMIVQTLTDVAVSTDVAVEDSVKPIDERSIDKRTKVLADVKP